MYLPPRRPRKILQELEYLNSRKPGLPVSGKMKPGQSTHQLRIPDSYDATISKNLQPLDIPACNSANKPSFLNPTKSLKSKQVLQLESVEHWAKRQKGVVSDFEKWFIS